VVEVRASFVCRRVAVVARFLLRVLGVPQFASRRPLAQKGSTVTPHDRLLARVHAALVNRRPCGDPRRSEGRNQRRFLCCVAAVLHLLVAPKSCIHHLLRATVAAQALS